MTMTTFELERHGAITILPRKEDVPKSALTAGALQGVIADIDTLASLIEDWHRLEANAVEGNIYFTADMLMPAIRHMGRDQVRVALAFRQTDGEQPRRLVGLMPIAVSRRRYGPLPAPAIVWRHSYLMVGAPLLDRSCHVEALKTLLDTAAGMTRLGTLVMPYLRRNGPVYQALQSMADRGERRLEDIEAFERAMISTDLSGPEYLNAMISGSRQKTYRRFRRRLEDEGELTFHHHQTIREFVPAFEEFLALEASGWKGRSGTAIAELPDDQAFFAATLPVLAARKAARLYALRLNGKPIAMMLAILQKRDLYAWKMAFDEAYAARSPGVLMMIDATRHMIDDPAV
ncbi:MAG: GNAT family N-acetyltransferase, partial [Hyphomicrobiales bacterium]|nr:GNAT family N-acetyltransferase [Hyphomicrobiales bacterium]